MKNKWIEYERSLLPVVNVSASDGRFVLIQTETDPTYILYAI